MFVVLFGGVRAAVEPCPTPSPFVPYTFTRTLGTGASGTALLVSKGGAPVVLKAMLCNGQGAVNGWKNEEANYLNIGLITADICPLYTKSEGAGWKCNGLTTTDNANWATHDQLGAKGGRVDSGCRAEGEEPVDCCWSVLQIATGSFPYGKDGPRSAAVRASALQTQVWMYQLLFALYAGWNTVAFQHWDLKEANVMVGAWPADVTKMCFYHTNGVGGGKCITNADTQADAKLLKMIDFDLSTSGGIGAIPRVKNAGANKKDGDSLKAMFENIRPEGAKTAAEDAFIALLDAISGASPAGIKDTLSSGDYGGLSTAYANAMKAAYFADLEAAPAPATCSGACAKAVSVAAYPAEFVEQRSTLRKSRLHQKVLQASLKK